jgi:hypothetical protein
MLDNIGYDDSDAPAIGLVPPGASWDEVRDHIKISHAPLIVGPDGNGQYTGAYWSGTEMRLASDLGSDQGEAIEEFRGYLREQGEA